MQLRVDQRFTNHARIGICGAYASRGEARETLTRYNAINMRGALIMLFQWIRISLQGELATEFLFLDVKVN